MPFNNCLLRNTRLSFYKSARHLRYYKYFTRQRPDGLNKADFISNFDQCTTYILIVLFALL